MSILINKGKLLSIINEIEAINKYMLGLEIMVKDEFGSEKFSLSEFKEKVQNQTRDQISIEKLFPEQNLDDPTFFWWGDRVFVISGFLNQYYKSEHLDSITIDDNKLITGKETFNGHLTVNGDLSILDNENNGLTSVIVSGDLTVKGKLILDDGIILIVIGDLIVDDSIYGGDEYYHLSVCGNLISGSYIDAPGDLFIAGRMEAPFIYVHYNHGRLNVLNGINSKVFIEADHPDSYVWGKSNIGYVLTDELIGLEKFNDKSIDSLKGLLKNDIFYKIKSEISDSADNEELAIILIDEILNSENNLSIWSK